MRSRIKTALGIAALSLMLAAPAYAHAETANGGNGGLGNGMGTPSNGSNVRAQNVDRTNGHEISVYGTGTGSQFRSVNPGAPGTTNINNGYGYGNRTSADGAYRAAATNSGRGIGWGWLGLLGLFGLFGIRNRNPQRNR
jgi:MYXO-CTERM domain-containing protein